MMVNLDRDKCVGAGQCVMAAPAVFDQADDDGLAVLLDPAPTGALEEDAREAARVCPALAIHLAED